MEVIKIIITHYFVINKSLVWKRYHISQTKRAVCIQSHSLGSSASQEFKIVHSSSEIIAFYLHQGVGFFSVVAASFALGFNVKMCTIFWSCNFQTIFVKGNLDIWKRVKLHVQL